MAYASKNTQAALNSGPRLQTVQGLFMACLLMLGASGGAGGTLLFQRWQSEKADPKTPVVLNQTAQLFAQTLKSQKKTVEVLRDTMASIPALNEKERLRIIRDTSEQIPHLAVNGWIGGDREFTGWVYAGAVTSEELDRITRQVLSRSGWRRIFGARSVFLMNTSRGRSLLVFAEPLRGAVARSLVSAIDLNALLGDLLRPELERTLSLQVLQDGHLLYRSPNWKSDQEGFFSRTVQLEGIGWQLEAQGQVSGIVTTVWFSVLTGLLAMMACFSVAGMIWATSRLRQLATTDELTRLYNRRFFLERWEEEVDRAKRYGREISCMVIDVNGFKRINDTNGHLAGDKVLKEVAAELRRMLRRTDILARFGGDEFVVGLPETDFSKALVVAEKLRTASLEVPIGGRRTAGPVTLSVGIAQLRGTEAAMDVVERADQDLYSSRRASKVSRVLELNARDPQTAAH